MKILALDTGDVWTGVAISDGRAIIAQPYETIKANKLIDFLQTTLAKEQIETIVVGHPKTMRGTESEQTKKVVALVEQLKQQFPDISWVLWDERLTSKQAAALKKIKTKEDKIKSHAIAAALILSSYLEYRRF